MKHIQPWFYDQFRCIAQHCSDTCCAGWDICIDADSLARYQADDSPFGLYRQSKIVETEEGPVFALEKTGHCPFLTAENLCTMIVEAGEESLCHICTHHPRFYKAYGPYDESGIGLCCPEGSRLLLSAPLRFRQKQSADETDVDPMAETIFQLRELLQEILLDRSMDYGDRCAEAMAVAWQAQSQLYGVDSAQPLACGDKLKLWQGLLTEMMALLPINQAWQQYLQDLETQLPALVAGEPQFVECKDYDPDQYGDMAAYILYRHFPDSLLDGAILGRLTFALMSTQFVHLCYVQTWLQQGQLTPEDKVLHLKNWSKQVEYYDENTQQFLEACKENGALGRLLLVASPE